MKLRFLILFFLSICIEPTSIQGQVSNKGNSAISDAYLKLWNKKVQGQIEERIEHNRKGEVTLELVDEAGNPLKGASLEIHQKTHEFLFGCNAFVIGQLGSPEKDKLYEELFTRICNFATVPIYWAGTEPKEGALRYSEGVDYMWRRPPVDRFIPFAKKHEITLKAHPMLWHEHNPDWLPKDPEALKELYRKRFLELSNRYAKDIKIWEVTNESSGCHKTFPLYSEDRNYVPWAFKEASPLFGDKNLLMINDFTHFNEDLPVENTFYYKQISMMQKEEIRLQGIGLQFHLWFEPNLMEKHLAGERYKPETMIEVYDDFDKLNCPLYITEITVPTLKGENGEMLQATVLRNLYRLWFSTPNMAGITYWNLGDGTAYGSEDTAMSGLIDKELKPKESYRVLDELINHEWRTNLILKTNKKGETGFRGFYGTYEVIVNNKGKQQSFDIDVTGAQTIVHRLTVQ